MLDSYFFILSILKLISLQSIMLNVVYCFSQKNWNENLNQKQATSLHSKHIENDYCEGNRPQNAQNCVIFVNWLILYFFLHRIDTFEGSEKTFDKEFVWRHMKWRRWRIFRSGNIFVMSIEMLVGKVSIKIFRNMKIANKFIKSTFMINLMSWGKLSCT